jgi:stearoyl-CoA desaturase (delta-9 desaturase)
VVLRAAAIVVVHAGAAAAIVRGGSPRLLALAAALYLARMFVLSAGYHRYFAHRAYRTSRGVQLLIAILGTTAMQRGPLWWASMDRLHHRAADSERDVHSPVCGGFFWAHLGWSLGRRHEAARLAVIRDFAGYPELRLVERWNVLGPLALSALLLVAGGVDALLWGYAVSTCLLIHASGSLASVAHRFGTRRYATADASRNSVLLALLTLGEGWHNNHHHYMNSACFGFRWWEVDVTFSLLRFLARLGVVWDLRALPAHTARRHLVAEVGERCAHLRGGGDRRDRSLPVPAVFGRG